MIDFGFAIVTNKKLSIVCGTPSYMAPEINSHRDYFGPPADVWAAGIVLYVMLVGQLPFFAPNDKNL